MHVNTCKPTHKYGVDEEALAVCIKTLGLASHTQDCALSRAQTKCAGNEERRHWMYIKNISTRVRECILPQTFKLNHINTHVCWIGTRMYTLSHNMNMYFLTLGSEYTAIHADGTYCKAHRHLHTPSIACDRCWQEYCQEESSFVSFYSLCILACLSPYTVWPCHRSGFFSLPVPLCMFLFFFSPPFSRVIIVKLKSFVPREIRRESGKAMGTLAKIFLSVMS